MTKVGIIGGTGYTGVELIRLLARHPYAELTVITSRAESGRRVSQIFPSLRGICELEFSSPDSNSFSQCDVVFSATPNGIAMSMARQLLDKGIRLIDLAADFRIRDVAVWEHWYGMQHACPELLEEAVYGLPEMNRAAIRRARLVANPGCYPTSAILALAPLVDAGALRGSPRPVVDAISGVSGAGRAASLHTHFCEVSVQPYGVLRHRHTPEIDAYAGVPVVFTPHLGPYDRGILATIHAQLAPGWTAERVGECLATAYDDEPFVRLLPAGAWPSIAGVRGTNFCDLAFDVDPIDGHLVMASAIDNLVKGAAGQAVQCMNIRFALPETAGLLRKEAA